METSITNLMCVLFFSAWLVGMYVECWSCLLSRFAHCWALGPQFAHCRSQRRCFLLFLWVSSGPLPLSHNQIGDFGRQVRSLQCISQYAAIIWEDKLEKVSMGHGCPRLLFFHLQLKIGYTINA